MIDPTAVPLTPLITIIVSNEGGATVDGEPVATGPDGTSVADPRTAALAVVRIRAARLGRAVRVNAIDRDGTAWPLLVDPDGRAHPLASPHPVALPRRVPAPASPVEVPQDDWLAEPADTADLVAVVRQAERAGNLAGAVAAAHDLQSALLDAYGPQHPHTVNGLHLRAYFALVSGRWTESAQWYLAVAEGRDQLAAPPEETVRATYNAVVSSRRMTDTPTALRLGPRLLALLENVAPRQVPAFRRRLHQLQHSESQND